MDEHAVKKFRALASEFRQEGWRGKAACNGMPTETFIAGRTAEALAVCSTCEVTEPCRDYAIETGMFGVWGGLTTHGRKKHRNSTRLVTDDQDAPLEGERQITVVWD